MNIVISAILLLFLGLWLKSKLTGSHTPTQTTEFVHGPFSIKMKHVTTSEFNMNYGRKYKRTHIEYTVLMDGKPIQFPDELQTNTGFSHLWRVYIVKDAPRPTLFAGSQNLFMITTNDDTYEISKLDVRTSDFIEFQWLDASHGQPSPAFELFMADERTSMEHPDTLQGGQYLMISKKLVVFIPTMEMYYFNKDNKSIENFGISGTALAFSPDKKVIVFPSDFHTWNTNEIPKYSKGLMAYDYKNDSAKVLPYSKNETRLYRPEDMNYEWFEKYFKWEINTNETLLTHKKQENTEHWEGFFKENSYYLYPVDHDMVMIFRQFILEYMQWTTDAVLSDDYHEYTGRVFRLGTEKPIFYLTGKGDEVHLMNDIYETPEESTHKLIREIGLAFNEQLKSGKYQENFTSIPEHEEY